MKKVIVHHFIIEKCNQCNKIIKADNHEFCRVFAFPDKKWRSSNCPMASHLVKEGVKDKQRVGQQKQHKVKVKHKK
jgi:hypothetical protein